jgi:hypothetical protein
MAVFLHEIFEAARITGRGDEGIAHGKDSFGNVAAQTAGAAGYQPDFRHESSIPLIRRTVCKLRLTNLLALRVRFVDFILLEAWCTMKSSNSEQSGNSPIQENFDG